MGNDINITDRHIQALIDDELDDNERKTLMAKIIRSPYHLKRYEELIQQKSMLQEWWDHFHHQH